MNPQQVARAGELYVAAEIHRRGGYAVTFAGNMPGIDILASDVTDQRRISIQVKTKSRGSWHARGSRDGIQRIEDPAESSFWIFVDLAPAYPTFYVAPRWWVQNDIWTDHTAYLARYEREHGAPRDSDHHGILTQRVEQWRDRWDVLAIF
jgi:hypothetical protein